MTICAKKQIFILMISVSIILSFIIITFTGQWSRALAQNADINLLGQNSTWRPFSAAIVIQNDTSLEILVATNHTDKSFHRAYLPMRISSSNPTSFPFTLPTGISSSNATSIPFALEYASKSNLGNATFQAQVRDNSTKVIWTGYLNNTGGQLYNKTFSLPSSILNRPVEFRFNIVTNGTGEHTFDVKKATMWLTNATQTQPLKVEFY